MTIETTRAHVVSSIWQAVAQSGVDLSSLPREQQARLVDAIADNLLGTVDQMLDQALAEAATAVESEAPAQAAPAGTVDEQVLWTGRPYLSLVESYTLTTERVRVMKGLFSRGIENFELIRVQDIDFSQRLGERMLGIGDVVIRGADTSNPEIILRNVRDPEKVYETLRRAWLEARKRYGLQFREQM
jgi:hypothetical protein